METQCSKLIRLLIFFFKLNLYLFNSNILSKLSSIPNHNGQHHNSRSNYFSRYFLYWKSTCPWWRLRLHQTVGATVRKGWQNLQQQVLAGVRESRTAPRRKVWSGKSWKTSCLMKSLQEFEEKKVWMWNKSKLSWKIIFLIFQFKASTVLTSSNVSQLTPFFPQTGSSRYVHVKHISYKSSRAKVWTTIVKNAKSSKTKRCEVLGMIIVL